MTRSDVIVCTNYPTRVAGPHTPCTVKPAIDRIRVGRGRALSGLITVFIAENATSPAEFLGAVFGPLRSLILPLVKFCQEPASGLTQSLKSLSFRSLASYGREELRSLDELISRADALLDGPEADFHRPFVDAFRAMARALNRPRIER